MFELIYEGGGWSVGRWSCVGHDTEVAPELVGRHEIVIPVRGAFLRNRSGTEVLATANQAVLADAGDSYRVHHPVAGGDECLVYLFDRGALEDLGRTTGFVAGSSRATFRRYQLVVSGPAHLAALRLVRDGGAMDSLAVENLSETLLTRLISSASPAPAPVSQARRSATTTARHRRAVNRGAAFIAARYRSPISLNDIAAAAAYSPFHFARVFRRIMGVTTYRFVLRLRLRDAASQILAGERDLSAMALRLGFASHSHMTAAFRAEYGSTPSEIRARSR